MQTKLLLAATVLLVFGVSFLAKGLLSRPSSRVPIDTRQCRRIVSMAPSITETLYALGLGDRVVGVTRYCKYPPEARQKPQLGGFFDPNFEALLTLRPDLVMMLLEHEQSLPGLRKLGLPALVVCHRDVTGILDSFGVIGRACGPEAKARQIADDIRARLDRIRRKTAGRPRPRVLMVIERTIGSGRLEDVYVAGSDGFFDKIIALAGGQNACRSRGVRFPVVSAEGILWMNPQVIVDMTAGLAMAESDQQAIIADWQSLARVEAVANGRVYAVDQDYAFVPGPRFILLVEDLARLIHPELEYSRDSRGSNSRGTTSRWCITATRPVPAIIYSCTKVPN